MALKCHNLTNQSSFYIVLECGGKAILSIPVRNLTRPKIDHTENRPAENTQ